MKTAAIYCRVSTDNQEQEGTSLQTQLEACLKYCRDRGYDVVRRFSEAYSGLSLERPLMNELRELVRSETVDVVVVYSTDRYSRDPTHGVILTQELEKHGVKLEAVIETVESTELGKLISYIRGFASRLEAEKIRERTLRGRIASAKNGRISSGFQKTYGYDYIPASPKTSGRRIINEAEAKWVTKMFLWLVQDGLSIGVIRDRLMEANVPSKEGNKWYRTSIAAILKNPAYAGKTYAFTSIEHKVRQKSQEEWIEIPGVTPPIISQELFETAQKQLLANQVKSKRNTKRQYLLSGHVRCRHCDHAYVGGIGSSGRSDGSYKQLYRCLGKWKWKDYGPIHRCHNKSWSASKLEELVWGKIQHFLSDRDLVTREIERQRQDTDRVGNFETELQQVDRQLKTLNQEQEQLLQWALKGFPEETVLVENKRINQKRSALQVQKRELESQIKASLEAIISIPKLENFVELIRDKIANLDFESKRQALEMLDITVWLNGENVEIAGFIPIEEDVIASTPSYRFGPT